LLFSYLCAFANVVLLLIITGNDAACCEQRIQAVLQESACSIIGEFETVQEFFQYFNWITPNIQYVFYTILSLSIFSIVSNTLTS